jgi:phage repressor protein C with HTH and peptisase S24 domain
MILRQWPSADRLARAMGVSPSAFRKWLKGEAEPSRERLVALATAAKVGIGWLATGEGPEPDFANGEAAAPKSGGEPVALERFVMLPRRPTTAAAGPAVPPLPEDVDSEYVALRQDWVRRVVGIDPAHLGLELAVGDSMVPTIRDGDVLLVDTSDRRFAQFGIYVLKIDGERLVKRIQRRLDGSLALISDNPSYERDGLPPERAKDVEVVGRVVWSGGRVA